MAVTTAIAAVAVTAAGTAYSAYSANQAAKYNAAVADQNAKLAKQQAALDEKRYRQELRQRMGSAHAAVGATGITLDSAADVLESNAIQGEQDALLIRARGANQSTAYGNEARLQRYQGKQEAISGYVSAAGKLIGGGSDIYANYG